MTAPLDDMPPTDDDAVAAVSEGPVATISDGCCPRCGDTLAPDGTGRNWCPAGHGAYWLSDLPSGDLSFGWEPAPT